MELQNLSDAELVTKTKGIAAAERKLGVIVLHHLREIEARRIFLARGYGSLFEFCVKELGYTEAAAGRRVRAMRLLFNLPDAAVKNVEASLNSGELSLTSLSTLENFFNIEKKERQKHYSGPERMALINELKNKSSRQAEKVLAQVSPLSVRRKDFTRAVTATETVVRFTADEALMAKLERLKELMSHQLPTHDMNTLLNKLADIALKTLEKQSRALQNPAAPQLSAQSSFENPETPSRALQNPPAPQGTLAQPATSAPRSTNPRYIPAKLKAALLIKAQHRCEFTDTITKRRCSARHYLQIDHITPVAHGGAAVPANLRVFCAAHNRYAAARLGLGI